MSLTNSLTLLKKPVALKGLRKNKCILVCGRLKEKQSVCYVYDIIFFSRGIFFVLSPFQYHNALQEAQMLFYYNMPNGDNFVIIYILRNLLP